MILASLRLVLAELTMCDPDAPDLLVADAACHSVCVL
jgi:hypothetical protein